MTAAARVAVVAALRDLATSPHHQDRADAGQALAAFAGTPEARPTLMGLLLDAGDTWVTQVTAEALLRRHDDTGLALVAAAMADAGDDAADHLGDAVDTVFMIFAAERDAALDRCAALARHPDDRVRRGVVALRAALTGLNPVLRVVPPTQVTTPADVTPENPAMPQRSGPPAVS